MWCICKAQNYTPGAPQRSPNHLNCKHIVWNKVLVWKIMRNKYATIHVMKRDEMFYYVRHIPNDLTNIYSVKILFYCYSLCKVSIATIRWLLVWYSPKEYGCTCNQFIKDVHNSYYNILRFIQLPEDFEDVFTAIRIFWD